MSTFLMIHFLNVLSLWRHKKRGKMRPFSFPVQREMQMVAAWRVDRILCAACGVTLNCS